LTKFEGTTGNLIKGSFVTVDDTGKMNVPSLVASGIAYPLYDGKSGQTLITNGSGKLCFVDSASGIIGPQGAPDSSVPIFSGSSGQSLISTSVLIDNTGLMHVPSIQVSGLKYPMSDGTAHQVLTTDGSGNLSFENVPGSDGIIGPPSASDNSIALFDGFTGKLLKSSLLLKEEPSSLKVGSLSYPSVDGMAGQSLVTDGTGKLGFQTISSGGDVVGPQSSVSDNLAMFSDASGKSLSDSGVKVTASGLKVGSLEYPSVDGTPGSVLTTDGSGKLSLAQESVLSVNGQKGDVSLNSAGILMLSGETVESAINSAAILQTASQTSIFPPIGGKTDVQSSLEYISSQPISASSVSVSPPIGGGSTVQNVLTYLDNFLVSSSDIGCLLAWVCSGDPPSHLLPVSGGTFDWLNFPYLKVLDSTKPIGVISNRTETTFTLMDINNSGRFLRGGTIPGIFQNATQIFNGCDTYHGVAGVRSDGESPITDQGRPASGHANSTATLYTSKTGSVGVRPINISVIWCLKVQ
jgi:hypothetical protein